MTTDLNHVSRAGDFSWTLVEFWLLKISKNLILAHFNSKFLFLGIHSQRKKKRGLIRRVRNGIPFQNPFFLLQFANEVSNLPTYGSLASPPPPGPPGIIYGYSNKLFSRVHVLKILTLEDPYSMSFECKSKLWILQKPSIGSAVVFFVWFCGSCSMFMLCGYITFDDWTFSLMTSIFFGIINAIHRISTEENWNCSFKSGNL